MVIIEEVIGSRKKKLLKVTVEAKRNAKMTAVETEEVFVPPFVTQLTVDDMWWNKSNNCMFLISRNVSVVV